jgi:rhodanese-related sulfurtransferase
MPVPEITADELAERLARPGVRLFDVRQPHEYENGHVPAAVLIPLNDVPDRLGEFPTDCEVLVICRTGARSRRACEFLIENGVTAINIAGGTLSWMDTGREVTGGSSPS